jgi:hypothetical protein
MQHIEYCSQYYVLDVEDFTHLWRITEVVAVWPLFLGACLLARPWARTKHNTPLRKIRRSYLQNCERTEFCVFAPKTKTKTKTKLHGLSPRANYTDWVTAACRRSNCQLLRIEGATWSVWRIPTAVFSISRQEPLLFYQVAPQLYSRGWVDHVPDPLLFSFQKIW